jgi:subtilisin family serine protease
MLSSDGICGKALAAIKSNRSDNATAAAINSLVDGYQELASNDRPQISIRLVVRGPIGFSQQSIGLRPVPTPSIAQSSTATAKITAKISVGVLDTGINRLPGLLAAGSSLAAGQSFAFHNSLRLPMQDDYSNSAGKIGHGTGIAGLLSAFSGNTSLNIVPIKACDGGGECRSPSLIAGICYAASLSNTATPLRVLNISLGGTEHSPLLYQALTEAAERGISIVVAAGNNRQSSSSSPERFPARYASDFEDGASTLWPAVPGLISVGSALKTGTTITPSAFSNAGPWISLVAIGENINMRSSDGRTVEVSGTSYAAPQVSGALAMLYDRDSVLTPLLAKAALLKLLQPIAGCDQSRCGAGLLLPPR